MCTPSTTTSFQLISSSSLGMHISQTSKQTSKQTSQTNPQTSKQTRKMLCIARYLQNPIKQQLPLKQQFGNFENLTQQMFYMIYCFALQIWLMNFIIWELKICFHVCRLKVSLLLPKLGRCVILKLLELGEYIWTP